MKNGLESHGLLRHSFDVVSVTHCRKHTFRTQLNTSKCSRMHVCDHGLEKDNIKLVPCASWDLVWIPFVQFADSFRIITLIVTNFVEGTVGEYRLKSLK